MVGCLWSLWFDPQHFVVHVHNPSSWEVELGESGVQGRIQGLPRLCERDLFSRKEVLSSFSISDFLFK